MTSTSPAKKTVAKKAKPEFGAKFGEYRERAINLRGSEITTTVTNEPFVLGTDLGFSTEITLTKPSFKTRLAIESAFENGQTIRLLQLMFGNDVDAILDDLDEYEEQTGESSNDVLFGIILSYLEHFYGAGSASEVFTKLSI